MKKRAQAPKSSRKGGPHRPERLPGDQAQKQRREPGEGDKYRGAPPRQQGVLPKHPQPPLQLKERPATGRQIFANPARLVLILASTPAPMSTLPSMTVMRPQASPPAPEDALSP